jgi:hypothetical protein
VLASGIHTGGQVRETARAKEVTLRGMREEAPCGTMAVFWLRGLVLCRRIADRTYRLQHGKAATKSASRSLWIYILNIIYYITLHYIAHAHTPPSPSAKLRFALAWPGFLFSACAVWRPSSPLLAASSSWLLPRGPRPAPRPPPPAPRPPPPGGFCPPPSPPPSSWQLLEWELPSWWLSG